MTKLLEKIWPWSKFAKLEKEIKELEKRPYSNFEAVSKRIPAEALQHDVYKAAIDELKPIMKENILYMLSSIPSHYFKPSSIIDVAQYDEGDYTKTHISKIKVHLPQINGEIQVFHNVY